MVDKKRALVDRTIATPEAAQKLGVSADRVRQLIKVGRLPAQQFGRDYLIRESDLALVADRKPGRPKKTDEAEAVEATRASAPVKARPATKKQAVKKGSG